MSIRVSRNISALGLEELAKRNKTFGKRSGQLVEGYKNLQPTDDVVVCKDLEELNSSNRITKIALANLNAANSTKHNADFTKEIAILTRNYIFKISRS